MIALTYLLLSVRSPMAPLTILHYCTCLTMALTLVGDDLSSWTMIATAQ